MPDLTEFDKLDIILKYLEKIKGLKTDTHDISLYLFGIIGKPVLNIYELLEHLNAEGLITLGVVTKPSVVQMAIITAKGSIFINSGGYEKEQQDKQEIATLEKQKLMIDITNAENVYESYKGTRFIAWAGFVISICAILLDKCGSEIRSMFHK